MFATRSLVRPSAPIVATGVRQISSASSPNRAWTWTRRALGGMVLLSGGSAMYSYYRLKKVLTLERYLTEEEVNTSREMAQRIITEHNGNLTPVGIAALGPQLMAPYIPLVIEREASAGPDVRERKSAEAAAQAQEIFGVAFSRDKDRAWKVAANFMFYLVYTPEQMEVIAKSAEAQKLMKEGKLLTALEIAEMKQKQWEEGGNWGDR